MEIKTDLHLKFFLFFRQLGNSSFCCLALGVALLFYRFPADVSSVGLFFPTSNFLCFFFLPAQHNTADKHSWRPSDEHSETIISYKSRYFSQGDGRNQKCCWETVEFGFLDGFQPQLCPLMTDDIASFLLGECELQCFRAKNVHIFSYAATRQRVSHF